MNVRYRVELSQAERGELTAMLSKGKRAARKLKRAQILLAADAGHSDEEIARTVAVGGSTVHRTKRRFVEGNLERALSEDPRPGAERKLTGKEEALLVATACANSSMSIIPMPRAFEACRTTCRPTRPVPSMRHSRPPKPGEFCAAWSSTTPPSMPAGSTWSRSRSVCSVASAWIAESTTPSASSAKSLHGRNNGTPPAHASNGCSQPKKPARKWAAPIPSRPKSHNHCAEVLVELSLEGRRRVKEQLKKMGSFEFHQTSFSLIDNETREEKFIGVPEQGGRDMISLDPLAPGSVYTSSVDDHAKVGLYRLEVGCSPGTGKLKIAGGVEGLMRESINRAFAYLMGQKVKMGVGQQVDTTDFHVEAIDLLSNHVSCEAGIALVVAIYSALKRMPVQAGLVILGDLSIQGNIKPMRSLAEPLQVAMDNGARKALIPLENKRNFLDVTGDIVERVDPVFFSDPMTAAMKALGMM